MSKFVSQGKSKSCLEQQASRDWNPEGKSKGSNLRFVCGERLDLFSVIMVKPIDV